MTEKPRSLKYRTWELLKGTDQTPKEVAKAINVTPSWVRLFLANEIKDPGVNVVQRLYEHLTGQPLFKD